MRHVRNAALGIAVLCLCAGMGLRACARVRVDTCVCVRVVDGDTIDVDIAGEVRRVRYLGYNAPELKGETRSAGERAKQINAGLVSGKQLVLLRDPREADIDCFGRLLRRVYVDGLDVAREVAQRMKEKP